MAPELISSLGSWLTRPRPTRRRRRRGIAAVEFGLTLPVFMLVLSGVVELSNFVSSYHHVQRAARDGARVGSITIEGPNPDGSVIKQAAAQQAMDVLEASGKSCSVPGCVVAVDWFSEQGYMFVSVTVVYPYEPMLGLFGQFANESVAQFTMMTQQQLPPPQAT